MDSLHSPSHSASTPESLERDLRSLRLSVQVMLVSLVILCGSIGVYLFRQVSLLRRQAEATHRTAEQMAVNYNQNLATQAIDFERQLIAFARTNQDLQARLARFFPNGMGTAPSSTPPSSTPPAPQTPPAAPNR